MRKFYLKMANLGISVTLTEGKIQFKEKTMIRWKNSTYLKNNKLVQVCVYSFQINTNHFSGITVFVLYFSEMKHFAIKSVKLSNLDNDYSC